MPPSIGATSTQLSRSTILTLRSSRSWARRLAPPIAVTTGYGSGGKELLSAFPDFSAEPLEVRDLGDLVLGALHVRGHGAGSDVQFDQTIWQIGEWRDGKLLWFRTYPGEREALEAAGLRE